MVKVFTKDVQALRQPFLKLVEDGDGVCLIIVDERGNHVTDLLSFNAKGCYTHAHALEDLENSGPFDLTGFSFDTYGSLVVNANDEG